jgi:hypothetical protein
MNRVRDILTREGDVKRIVDCGGGVRDYLHSETG